MTLTKLPQTVGISRKGAAALISTVLILGAPAPVLAGPDGTAQAFAPDFANTSTLDLDAEGPVRDAFVQFATAPGQGDIIAFLDVIDTNFFLAEMDFLTAGEVEDSKLGGALDQFLCELLRICTATVSQPFGNIASLQFLSLEQAPEPLDEFYATATYRVTFDDGTSTVAQIDYSLYDLVFVGAAG